MDAEAQGWGKVGSIGDEFYIADRVMENGDGEFATTHGSTDGRRCTIGRQPSPASPARVRPVRV